MIQHPIYLIVVAIITLILVVVSSIQFERILKFQMGLSFLNIAIAVVSFFTYDLIESSTTISWIYIGFTAFVYLLFLITFYSMFKTSTLKANHYQLFVKSIKNSKWNAYYVVDRKERIKDMSTSFLIELGMEKEEVMGKKLFNVFNKTVRFIKLNSQETNNRLLESYYSNFKNQAKPGYEEVDEIIMLNHEGVQVLFKLVTQPVYNLGKYKGRICVGEKRTDYDLLSVEKELSETSNELESIRHKFIATLEISKEGLFYVDLDQKTIWASDALIEMLKLPNNQLNITDFRRRINADDLQKYLNILSDLTLSKTDYQTSYRIMIDNRYVWVREKGKRLFEDTSGSFIMGTLNPLQTKHFMSSNIPILDDLENQYEMMAFMRNLFQESKYFELVLFKLKNIPKINDDHGREVGNMLMAEYIKNMHNTFITESGKIFRVSGLEFAAIITDTRKMGVLQQGIKQKKTFLNLLMEYGSIQVELNVFAGIASGGGDGTHEQEVYQQAEQALKIAENPQFENQGCYYKDIV